jgi:2-polyprenyl-3-methyl-5-hydroxy-6-metoxy-1,4-benzoquinol methylase
MNIFKSILDNLSSQKIKSIFLRKFLRSKYAKGTNKEIFEHIYTTNAWGSGESFSGTGSELSKTQELIAYIETIVSKYAVKSIMDVPCGDFNWMKHVALDKVDYTGADIVEKMIADNNRKYAKANIRFISLDLTIDSIDKKYDMIITRDCFVHLSFADIKRSLQNIISSGSVYLLTTSFIKTRQNKDINTGVEWRPINLGVTPFEFPEPIEFFVEKSAETNWESNKTIALYRISDLRSHPMFNS